MRVAISSNLCRCTGYSKIFDAAKALGNGSIHLESANVDDDAIGARMVRTDAVEKVTGHAVYAEDIQLPRMIYGALVRSTRAHANILSIDTSEAMNLPGVKAVVTGRDIEMGYYGYELHDHRVFALEKVRYLGEPVAAVAAVTPDIAREAAMKVKVKYEELPGVFDPEEAITPGAPLVHDDPNAYQLDWESERTGNLCYKLEFGFGDVERGFAESDRVITGTYRTPEAPCRRYRTAQRNGHDRFLRSHHGMDHNTKALRRAQLPRPILETPNQFVQDCTYSHRWRLRRQTVSRS